MHCPSRFLTYVVIFWRLHASARKPWSAFQQAVIRLSVNAYSFARRTCVTVQNAA